MIPVGKFTARGALTLALSGALTQQLALARQEVPAAPIPASWADASRPDDQARSCEEIEAEANLLLEKLGGESEALAAAATQVQEIGTEGSRNIAETVKKTSARQGLASTAAEAANAVPGGALISGVIGSAAGAATAADNRALAARQRALSQEMQAQMAALQQQATAAMPVAMRLQHLNALQAAKACPGAGR